MMTIQQLILCLNHHRPFEFRFHLTAVSPADDFSDLFRQLLFDLHQLPVLYHITTRPWGGFPRVDCSTTMRVQIPNGASSESSRRDVSTSNAYLLGTETNYSDISTTCGDISSMENRPRAVWCTPSFTVYTSIVYNPCPARAKYYTQLAVQR